MDDLRPGERFAGCRIEAVAGRGGMGIVYRATELALSRRVALKVVAPEGVADPAFAERFGREVRLAASIDHPNVVPVFGAGEEGGRLYLVMRYVDGTDLHALIRRSGRLEPARAAAIVAQIAAGLDAAHAAGLVHRDVKPANVLLTHAASPAGHDHVYLTDFGLTVEVSSDTRMTTSGQWIGSVDYMSPEQLRNEPVDARTDVYALGGVLYAALTGDAPFRHQTVPQTIAAHLGASPPRPSAKAPIDMLFDAVVARALAKDPADRYRSAGDLGRAAVAAARGERVTTGERVVARGEAAPSEEPTRRLTSGARTELPTTRRPAAADDLASGARAVSAAGDDRPQRDAPRPLDLRSPAAPTPPPTAAAIDPDENAPSHRGTTPAPGQAPAPASGADDPESRRRLTPAPPPSPVSGADDPESGRRLTPAPPPSPAGGADDPESRRRQGAALGPPGGSAKDPPRRGRPAREPGRVQGGAADRPATPPSRRLAPMPAPTPVRRAIDPTGGAQPSAASQDATTHVRRHRSRPRMLLVLAAVAAAVVVVAAVAASGGPGGRHAQSASLSAGEISAVAHDFATAYGDEDAAALRATLAPDVQRVAPDGAQQGRDTVLAVYRRQFAAADIHAYELDGLSVVHGAAGRAAGTYTVKRSGSDDLKGRVAFGVVREAGRAKIALIATEPE